MLIYSSIFHITSDKALHFPNKGVDDFVTISGMTGMSLTAFTVCLWMSSSNTEGTLFSYAVSGQSRDNELVIYYNRNFMLTIDNEDG